MSSPKDRDVAPIFKCRVCHNLIWRFTDSRTRGAVWIHVEPEFENSHSALFGGDEWLE